MSPADLATARADLLKTFEAIAGLEGLPAQVTGEARLACALLRAPQRLDRDQLAALLKLQVIMMAEVSAAVSGDWELPEWQDPPGATDVPEQ